MNSTNQLIICSRMLNLFGEANSSHLFQSLLMHFSFMKLSIELDKDYFKEGFRIYLHYKYFYSVTNSFGFYFIGGLIMELRLFSRLRVCKITNYDYSITYSETNESDSS
jgi:hypothetical protein